MFYIRADGNEKIGMGHIMRCLTIAQEIQAEGEEVCFLVADDKPVKVIRERGFQTKILFTYYDEMNVELPQLVLLFSEHNPKILVDSYYVTEFYLQSLRQVARVYLMDDLKTGVYPCDGLVNYNIYGKNLGYEALYPSTTRLFLGCEYMPLRPQFWESTYQVRKQVKNILVTTGGSDPCHMLRYLMQEILDKKSLQSWHWHVVCGPYCKDGEELEGIAREYPFFTVHQDVTDLSDLMLACDICVSSAGSTLYELCAVGIPSIGFYFVENQRLNMETFGKITPIMNAGDFSKEPEAVVRFLEKEMELLAQSYELRKKMSMGMKAIVDGQGAKRLARGLLE